MVRTLAAVSLLALSAHAQADSIFPIGRDWAGDQKLPRPYGISIDIFTLEQPYGIDELTFTLPGVTADPDQIDVQNRLNHEDVKFDVWVFPFLNVFGVWGHVHARTFVDLSAAQGAPIPLGTLPVRYSGQVYGGGFTAIYGGEHWFASVTGTFTETDLSGDFDSSVDTTTWQPRLGWVHGPWSVWAGGYYLDIEERHRGSIAIPVLGNVPFDVTLSQEEDWSPAVGVHYTFNDAIEVSLEVGGGNDRKTTLLNIGYRFGQ